MYRVNRRIRVPEVRVIGAEGGQLGIMPTAEALRLAEDGGMDLVEVSPKAVPPVCRIMDYGKFKYEQSKKTKAARRHQSTVTLKEIKFRPKTGEHDLDFKVRHVRDFLQEGNKAKLVIVFRGREIVHPETGKAVLDRVFREVQEIAAIEQVPLMEGRRMIMVLAPKVGVVRQASSGGVGATSSLAGSPVTGPATSPVSGSAGGQAGGQAGSPAGGPAAGTAGDRPGAVPGV